MILRAVAVWLLLVALAIGNGTLRTFLLVPRIGDRGGHVVSSLLLSAIVGVVAWATIRWMAPATAGDAWLVGSLWLGLTIAFEFGAGHYLFGNPWEKLLADYDVGRGRIWLLVLVTTLVAPVIAFRFRGGGGRG
jgi:hypothetical protein